MAKIISVVNQKGGTGKSACAANLGVGLALMNKKVLVVDADPQSDVSAGFGFRDCDNSNETLTALMEMVLSDEDIPEEGRYKAKTAMYETMMFLLIWYSASITVFQMIQSKVFIYDCMMFFDTITTFMQNIAEWIILAGKEVTQMGNGISNPVIAGIVYWLIRILICGGCLTVTGILAAIIGIKILLLLVQAVYVGIRWYVKGWREARGYCKMLKYY